MSNTLYDIPHPTMIIWILRIIKVFGDMINRLLFSQTLTVYKHKRRLQVVHSSMAYRISILLCEQGFKESNKASYNKLPKKFKHEIFYIQYMIMSYE